MKSKEIEQETFKLIKFGFSSQAIIANLNDKVEDKTLLKIVVETACKDYPDYNYIQYFMNSKIIVDKDADDDKLYMFNVARKELRVIDRTRLSNMLDSKLKWDHKRYTCSFVYNPFNEFKLGKVDGYWQYNLYEPPKWLEDKYYSCGEVQIPKLDVIPTIYDKYLKHLVNGDVKSYEYVLDWLTTAITSRNYCILTTIGNQGIGKGVLGEIMMRLVGEQNFTKSGKRIVDKDFNGQISGKRILYVDEVVISNADQENRMKDLINDYIEVEKKGVDAKLSRNYSSIYFSANQLDAIKITSDDRRFSIIELTNVKLKDVMNKNEIGSLLLEENIEKFAQYLYHRKVDSNKMMNVFTSPRLELIKAEQLNTWQEWLIEEFIPDNRGQKFTVRQVSEIVEEEWGSKCRPGRGALQKLERVYSNKLRIFKDVSSGKQVWTVQILK